jgi:hypothetical protein
VTQFTHRSGEGGWGAARADLNPTSEPAGWAIEHQVGSPAALLGLPIPTARTVRWCQPTSTAVVNGARATSGQLRRPTGGGAVLVRPGRLIWADVIIPRHDPLWVDDVVKSSWWLGQAWAAALRTLGIDADVYHGAKIVNDGPCFAGIVPGEVTVKAKKVVGISQRRTRAAALFQTAILRTVEPDETMAIGLDTLAEVTQATVESAFERTLV